MPEGDTVFRAARRLHEALAGSEVTRFDIRVPRSATADLRGVWNGDEYGRAADIADARHRVVLGIELGFEDRMIDLILSADSPR